MKKKLLFVNESLSLAGGEKSLINLLSLIDSAEYNVDLQLFSYGGELEAFLPSYVNILPPLKYSKFSALSWVRTFSFKHLINNYKLIYSKLKYSFLLRLGKYNNPQKAQIYWEAVSKRFETEPKVYDIAIAYAQGIPTFYVIDKIKANKKIAWVNALMNFEPINKKFQYNYYKRYNKIVTVSDITKKHFSEIFPELINNIVLIWDIIDYKSIKKMSLLEEDVFKKKNEIIILTVSRINKFQKGFDILLETCSLLKARKLDFKWYILGKGEYEEETLKFIAFNGLQNHLFLLGTKINPYPYFKGADIYTQTSRQEGYGLSIAEARMLNTPVVTTKFDSVYSQMIHQKNGLVVDVDPNQVADAIENLINDKTLYDSIVAFQKTEKKGNSEELQKFYSLINNPL